MYAFHDLMPWPTLTPLLDPNNPGVPYISTDANPVTGAALVSAADQ